MNYGRYEIGAEIGKGAMGMVYAAHDPKLNRQVAIKVLHKKLLYDDEAVQGFLKEAMLNAGLSHPNILTILDVGEDHGEVYIAMELLEGQPLSSTISSLDKNEILSIGMQIADALDFAHKKGVVHRDIKPANIMVRSDGQIKITDFGIAQGIGRGSDELLQTQTGVIKGTPAYMSPEQARGDNKNVDGRSDLFSLGVMLYEMSTGKRPFGGEGKDFMAVFGEILNKTPLEPCKVKETVGCELSTVIMKLLEKEPARRFQTGNELFQAFKACDRKETLPPKPGMSSRKPGIVIGASAAAVLALAIGAYFIFSPGKKETLLPQPQSVTSAPAMPSAPGVPLPATAPATGTTSPPVALPVRPSNSAALPPVATPPYPQRVTAGTSMVKPGKRSAIFLKPDEDTKKNTVETRLVPADTAPRTEKSSLPYQPGNRVPGESSATAGGEPAVIPYAFLKVTSKPAGAQVYINDSLKGMTPLKLRLSLGMYRVRLAHSGFKSVETSVTLDKMAEFPLEEELKAE